ncbi:MAG TPA: ceramidase domain-containing protein [Chitinophagales bacterium]|nr:ceramidase domain-containing protein [Chitinophagales bacterium]HQD12431.1 ceramidase domain-containing protein [Chitinophagales bacterium]HQO31162.1 ceramidase domain-containing protein [Chitinophagales bacterium]HQO90203.1 ceramidase domain-containing protein [Chitinophagales bacterium]
MLKYTFRIAVLFTVLVISLFYIALTSGWFGITDGTGGNFCEATRNGLILQPANSYSNIGFVISGLYGAWILSHRNINTSGYFFKHPFIPVFFCLVTILLGPCSMAMHATETRTGGLFDMNSMYLFGSFMFSYALSRFYSLSTFVFIGLYFAVVALCNIAGSYRSVFGLDFYPGSAAFGLVCIIGMLFEYLNLKKHRPVMEFKYAVYCSVSFIVAFGVWQFGWDGHCFCNPDSLFQWHGVWHLLCALSTFFLFRYYTSEKLVE